MILSNIKDITGQVFRFHHKGQQYVVLSERRIKNVETGNIFKIERVDLCSTVFKEEIKHNLIGE